MASEPLISVRQLTVQREGKTILRDVSFAIHAGDSVGVIGPNGAGKSTLFKTLIGLAPISSGEILLMGKPLKQFSSRERAQWIGYVPQAPEHGLSCTVEDFIFMGRYPYLSSFSPPGPQDRKIVDEVLKLTGTTGLRHRVMDTLSGGEKQKVLIAGAIAQQPKVLLLDEPASFLDPRNELEIQDLLQTINRETEMAMVIVSHHLNSMLRYSRSVLGLKDGQLIFDGSPQTLLATQALREIYDTEFRIISTGEDAFPVIFPERVIAP
jgi:ABC-type cobalamin/Fe3+-siderophores transport system ATPase subunit